MLRGSSIGSIGGGTDAFAARTPEAPAALGPHFRLLQTGPAPTNGTNGTNGTTGPVSGFVVTDSIVIVRNGPLERMWLAVYWTTFLLTYIILPLVQVSGWFCVYHVTLSRVLLRLNTWLDFRTLTIAFRTLKIAFCKLTNTLSFFMPTHTSACARARTHTHTHTHTHTYIYTHTHTHTHAFVHFPSRTRARTQEYVAAGDFTVWTRFKSSLYVNLLFYGVIGLIAAGALFYVTVFVGKGIWEIFPVLVSLANTYGLILVVLLIGYGCAEVRGKGEDMLVVVLLIGCAEVRGEQREREYVRE